MNVYYKDENDEIQIAEVHEADSDIEQILTKGLVLRIENEVVVIPFHRIRKITKPVRPF